MKILKFLPLLIIAATTSCSVKDKTSWTEDELMLIYTSDSTMRVLTVEDEEDYALLRTECSSLCTDDIFSEAYDRLSKLMVATVTSPEQDGVGIAGPQVGISRRVVAVQRLDKEGEPFEVYPNIRITAFNGEMTAGSEGCLSVPGKRGSVMRYRDIEIAYSSPKTGSDTTERIEGFTAVIFQHETDHLDGIIYTDKLVGE